MKQHPLRVACRRRSVWWRSVAALTCYCVGRVPSGTAFARSSHVFAHVSHWVVVASSSSSSLTALSFSSSPRRRSLPTTTTATAVEEEKERQNINPFLQQNGLPKFQSLQAEHLTPALDDLLTQLELDFVRFESNLTALLRRLPQPEITFDDVLPPLERLQFGLHYAWGVAGHLLGVQNSDKLREVYEANQPKIVQALTVLEQSKPLYDALLAAWEQAQPLRDLESKEDSFRASQKRRAMENAIRSMQHGGVGLEQAAKKRCHEINLRLAQLSTAFSNNVMDETKAFSETVKDSSLLDGVPESVRSMWANAHATFLKSQKGQSQVEIDPATGPWRITLDGPSYLAALAHIPDRSLREKIFRAFIGRASEASPEKNNIPIMYENLQLKSEKAQLLGFQNYAELSLASKMAPSVERITELHERILSHALRVAESELVEIIAYAREKRGDDARMEPLPHLEPWDIPFWSERLKESKYDLSEEDTRAYFSLSCVLDGMFLLVGRIFNIKIRAADGEAELWHPDVRFFKVFDVGSGGHIASFYLDPYSRPNSKQGGAWMDVCIGKSEATKRNVPVAYLTCNGSPPVGKKPSLMTFHEVETLFHEFGHGLQHMLTKANIGNVAGINGIEWDAVELPSQFLENW